MRILGRDFMAWYDTWKNGDYYWETPDYMEDTTYDDGGDRLHDRDGEWRLAPDVEYDLEWLGEIRAEKSPTPEVDTVRILTAWLARRGREPRTYRVGKDDAKAFEKRIGKLGQVLKAKAIAGQVRGVDFIDWYVHSQEDGFYVEENGDPLHDDDGTWLLDPEGFYELDDLGSLMPDDTSVQEDEYPDLTATFKAYLKARTVVPVLVLATPENHGRIAEGATDLLVPDEEEPKPEPRFAPSPQSSLRP